jgi:Rieske Fe-S protein
VATVSRRAFIGKIALLLAAAAGLFRYLTPRLPVGGRVLLTVRQSEVPMNSALVFRQERIALLRQGDDFYALSLVCTHLGCAVTVTADGLVCPCHGSRFDRQGRVVQGPARQPLTRHRIQRAGETLEVLAG